MWPTDDNLAAAIEDHRSAWLRLAVLTTGSKADGEDLLQDSLIALAKVWSHLSRRGTNAYMRRVIVNGAIDRSRKSHERPSSTLPDSPATEQILRYETDQAFFDLVRALPAVQRAALVCRYYLDMSEAQIARTLGCARPTVRSHIHRAIATLRDSDPMLAPKETPR